MFGKELFIRFTARVFLHVFEFVCASFPFGFEDEMRDLTVLVPGQSHFVYFSCDIVQTFNQLLTEAITLIY